ncbi:MAG TPA: SPOR domain-containing protein [Clostridiales bacterium]|nr:SPOR domain-containing protein [Clostridiales bacterium]
MRYSRIRRARNQKRYAIVLLIVFLILGGIYFLMAGTIGKAISNIITPILKTKVGTEQDGQDEHITDEIGSEGEDTELTLPKEENEDNQGPRITELIKIEAKSFFGIQLGAFNNKENALFIANELKKEGAAGYVLEDQFSRVLAIIFQSQDDTRAVIEQLKAQSVDSQIYELKCPGVDMEITASSEKVEGIKSSYAMVMDNFGLMESIIKDLDKDKITKEIALEKIRNIIDNIKEKTDQLQAYSTDEEGRLVLSGLKDFLSAQIDNLEDILLGNTSDRVEISSKIKYTYIDMAVKYKKYMEQIANG